MLIELRNGKQKEVKEQLGNALVARHLAREIRAEEEPAVEISPRTGQPKRQYRRRDMRAED